MAGAETLSGGRMVVNEVGERSGHDDGWTAVLTMIRELMGSPGVRGSAPQEDMESSKTSSWHQHVGAGASSGGLLWASSQE